MRCAIALTIGIFLIVAGSVEVNYAAPNGTTPGVPPQPKSTSPLDVYKYSGLTPEAAAAAITVPEGFEVKLFAGEPDVHQPIAFCLDDRGRLWVAEAYSYPIRQPDRAMRPSALQRGARPEFFRPSNANNRVLSPQNANGSWTG